MQVLNEYQQGPALYLEEFLLLLAQPKERDSESAYLTTESCNSKEFHGLDLLMPNGRSV